MKFLFNTEPLKIPAYIVNGNLKLSKHLLLLLLCMYDGWKTLETINKREWDLATYCQNIQLLDIRDIQTVNVRNLVWC